MNFETTCKMCGKIVGASLAGLIVLPVASLVICPECEHKKSPETQEQQRPFKVMSELHAANISAQTTSVVGIVRDLLNEE